MTSQILKNGYEFVALGSNGKRLRFQWGEINGPEAEEGGTENARLRGFIYDLARKIVQDYSVVVPLEMHLQLTEGEFREQDDGEVFESHWDISLTSPKYRELRSPEASGHLRIVVSATELSYFAQLLERPEENYHGAFRVKLELLMRSQVDTSKMIDMRDVADRMLRLINSVYQQEIRVHYPEWQTDYQSIPMLDGRIVI